MWQREKPEIGGKCVIKSNRVKNSFKSLCVHEYKKKSLANCWSESYAHFSCVFRMKNYRVLAAPIVGGDCMYFFFIFIRRRVLKMIFYTNTLFFHDFFSTFFSSRFAPPISASELRETRIKTLFISALGCRSRSTASLFT